MSEKVAREVAEAEFDRMCRARRVACEPDEMDEQDAAQFTELKKRVAAAIMRNELVVTEEGDPIYTPPVEGAKPLKFHRATAATFMAMDAKPGASDGVQAKNVRAIAEMTRTPPGEISKMAAVDYQFCQALATLFLAPR